MNGRDRTRDILGQLSAPTSASVAAAGASVLSELLVQLCATSLPVSGVGLTLMTAHDAPAGLVAATDGAAAVLEELQFKIGEGPSIEASRTGQPVLVADLTHASVLDATWRWPVFTPAALQAGVAAIFALPLRVGAIRIGVLNLYRGEAGALSNSEIDKAWAFADAAINILLHIQDYPDSLPTPLRGVLDERTPIGALPVSPVDTSNDSGQERPVAVGQAPELGLWAVPLINDRAVVHQATGMVSVTADVNLAQALVLVRARAYTTARPVSDVAEDIVNGSLRIGVDPAHGTPV